MEFGDLGGMRTGEVAVGEYQAIWPLHGHLAFSLQLITPPSYALGPFSAIPTSHTCSNSSRRILEACNTRQIWLQNLCKENVTLAHVLPFQTSDANVLHVIHCNFSKSDCTRNCRVNLNVRANAASVRWQLSNNVQNVLMQC